MLVVVVSGLLTVVGMAVGGMVVTVGVCIIVLFLYLYFSDGPVFRTDESVVDD